jgi:hypothetical protein
MAKSDLLGLTQADIYCIPNNDYDEFFVSAAT